MKRVINIKFASLLIGALTLFDQIIKNVIFKYDVSIILSQNFKIIPSLNEQAAGSTPIPQSLIIITSLALIMLLLYWLLGPLQPVKSRWALSFIIAGGLSNLIDRIFYGATIDFLAIYIMQANLADMYIVFGGIVVLITLYHQPLPSLISSKKES